MSANDQQADELIYVGLNGMNIQPSNELPIYKIDEDFKDSSTVEFLRKEVGGKQYFLEIRLIPFILS